jgi:hypothetical protein
VAYTVGSVSVEVVPDFRNAQNAITAFFRAQPDQMKVPVRPDIDARSVAAVERQAAEVGTRVGRAISEGASRSMSSTLSTNLARQIAKLEGDVTKARRTTEDASSQLRIAEQRLNEARSAGLKEGSRLLSLERAVEVQRRRMSEASRIEAEALAAIPALRQRLADEELRIAEETGRKLAVQRDRANAAEVQAEIATAKRVAAEEAKIRDKAVEAEIRDAERSARERSKIEIDAVNKLVKAHNDALKRVEKLRVQVEIDEQQAIKAGRHQGGLIARSVRHEIHQNAGLIAGVVAGALLLGAPLLSSAATTLFAGVGFVAAAQSQRVRSAWVGTWHDIRDAAVADAAVLVPTLERMAAAIGQSFQRMRPLVQDAFEALSAQTDVFTASVIRAGENALPGLVRAVQAGGPVVAGFGDLLEKIGSGLGDLFDRLRTVAPESGLALSQFGDLLAQALPLLGELLVVGVRVANSVLPALTAAFGGMASVLESVDGILPTVLTGFLAFRAVQGVGRFLGNFAANLGMAAIQGGAFSSVAGKAAGVVSGLARAMPAVGVAVGVVAAIMARAEAQADSWAQALLEGGNAADTARQEIAASAAGIQDLASGFSGLVAAFTPSGAAIQATATRSSEALEMMEERAEALYDAMSPIEQAQQDVSRTTNDLSAAMSDGSTTAAQLQAAKDAVAAAAARLAREEDKLAMATRGVTDAMVEQANQARALADSSFAYENALNDLEDAQAAYNDALAEGDEEEKSRALLAVQEAYNDVANAARDVAFDALPAMLNEQQKSIIADKAQLDALLALKAQYGDLGPILENQIAELTAATSGANANALAQAQLVAALGQVGIAASAIPDSKSVRVDALTDDARQRLIDLGFQVIELDDGSFMVTADTAEAEGALNDIDTHLANVDDTLAIPSVALDDVPFFGGAAGVLNSIRNLDSQRPTPEADLASGPYTRSYNNIMNSNRLLHLQRPTPIAALNDLASVARAQTVGAQRPTPTVNAVDNASGTLSRILSTILSIPLFRTSTITTVFRTIGSIPLFGGVGAKGGAVEDIQLRPIHRFAGGGAVVGPGFGEMDLVRATGPDPTAQYRIGNGEHIWDTRDVAMAGGQSAVYALRDLISTGKLGLSPVDTIRRIVDTGDGARKSAGGESSMIAGFVNHGTIELRDESQFYRQAEQSRREILASVLG